MILLLAGMLLVPAGARGQERPETAAPGTRMKLMSRVLGEEREFIVTLPAGYEQSQERYPLLLLLDGDSLPRAALMAAFLAQCGHIPPLIVAAVITPSQRHHYRDFTPTEVDYLPASGGAEKFLEFLGGEMIPLLESKYRCRPYRILSGHGLSGLFAIHALIQRPEAYGAALATSPSIAFADNWILPVAREKLARWGGQERFIFLAAGREKVTVPAMREFAAVLEKSGAAGLQWQCREADDEDQGSIAFIGLYQGLKALFADWRFPVELAGQGLPAIERHCRALEKKYGFPVALNDELLEKRSTQLFQEQDFDGALKILKLGAEAYPESIPLRYWLGFVYEKVRDLPKALENYMLAFRKAEAARHPMTGFYRQQAERLAKKLEGK
jgi:hypothetical protein